MVGDNGMAPALSEEQAEALMRSHMGKVRRLREQLATVNANLRNALKVAKADGYPKAEIDYALYLEKDTHDGSGEALAKRRREVQIARWLGHAIGTQPDIFEETNEKALDAATKEFEAGKRAGMEGETLKVPEWVQEPAQFTSGWHKGQEILQSTLPLTRSGAASQPKDGKPKGRKAAKAKEPAGEVVPFKEQLKRNRAKGDALEKGKPQPAA